MNRQILVVGAEQALYQHVWRYLEDEGYDITVVQDVGEAIKRLGSQRFDVLLADLKIPEGDALELLTAPRRIDPGVAVIALSADETVTIEPIVKAVKAGADDYLPRPIEGELMLRTISKVLTERQVSPRNHVTPNAHFLRSEFGGMISKNPRMQHIFEMIERVSKTDSTVFITGETGVGKELVAKAIHSTGPRRDMPFIAINCGALTETLLESELFGHERGSFTGAYKTKHGKFECAHKGTLFLDEIGDISAAMQVKLLRALQEKRVERVGGNQPIDVDVRVISATNQDIKEKLRNHGFRIDLFYRLNVIPIYIPPLRERPEDIPLLVQHVMVRLNKSQNRSINKVAPHAMEQLMDYRWPGNVRELENVIERAYITCDGEAIERFTFPQSSEDSAEHGVHDAVNTDLPFTMARSKVVQAFEKTYITEVLRKYQGNVSHIARKTGINPRTLWRKLSEYGLDRTAFKKKVDS